MNTPSKIVIKPYKSMQGKVSLIFFSIFSFVILIPGILAFSLSPEHDVSLLIFFLIFSFVINMVGVILFYYYPRANIIFDAELNEVIIRESKKPDRTISFTDLETFFIFEKMIKYNRYFFCINNSFGEFSSLFSTRNHEKTRKKSIELIKLVHGTLMDTDGSHVTWNETN